MEAEKNKNKARKQAEDLLKWAEKMKKSEEARMISLKKSEENEKVRKTLEDKYQQKRHAEYLGRRARLKSRPSQRAPGNEARLRRMGLVGPDG